MKKLALIFTVALSVCALGATANAQVVSFTESGIVINSDGSTASQGANFIAGIFPNAGQFQQFFWSSSAQAWQFSNTLIVLGQSRANLLMTGQSANSNTTNSFLQFGGTNPRNIAWNASLNRFQFQGNSQTLGTHTVNILEILGGSDLSEDFNVNAEAEIEPGTVVVIDPENHGELMISTKAYDRTVAGIVSGAGGLSVGMRMGQVGTIADGDHPVALSGRVYCKVDATAAAIVPGDLLTTSSTPGHAMKVLDHAQATGAVIGKAMTPLAQGETGLVLVLVALQ
jgi:hypothetical protein